MSKIVHPNDKTLTFYRENNGRNEDKNNENRDGDKRPLACYIPNLPIDMSGELTKELEKIPFCKVRWKNQSNSKGSLGVRACRKYRGLILKVNLCRPFTSSSKL